MVYKVKTELIYKGKTYLVGQLINLTDKEAKKYLKHLAIGTYNKQL